MNVPSPENILKLYILGMNDRGRETMRMFLNEPRRDCARCADCPFEGICHRNCKRLNIAYYDAGYCGLREFLEYAYPGLQRVARMFTRR